ncbi:MAG TPA: tetratricopeptide repeat protein [Caldilineae bacterium]|nr:tetratricopeptide repeat protein [Caldilineae bacterium]
MATKLGRFCDALIEAGWLAALIIIPLFFNVYSARVFEPDKISLLRAIALIMAGAWLTKQIDGLLRPSRTAQSPLVDRLRELVRTPLVLPALLLVLAYLISTIFSVTPRISFWGSYQRLQGTFTTLCYVVIFLLMLGHLRRPAQLRRLLYAVILTSVPISLYGIWQRLQQDPLPWGGDVVHRVAANMGNPIFVSAYLIMAFFLTLKETTEAFARTWNVEEGTVWDAILAGAGLFILAIQVVTGIVLSQSRGPFLGWVAGLYVFALLGLIALWRWASAAPRFPAALRRTLRWVWVAPIVLAVLLGGFLILLNLPDSPLAGLRQESGLGRLGTILDLETGTNRVRTLIWQGAVRMIAPHDPLVYPDGSKDRWNILRPLIGYGPESMWVAYNPFYPPELAHLERRNASPDRSHNETFDALIITGLLGFLAYFALFTSIFYYSLRWLGLIRDHADRNSFLALGAAGAILGILIPWALDHSLRLAGVGLPFGFIVGVVLYVTLAAFRARRRMLGTEESVEADPRRELLIIALLATIVAHFVEIHFGIAIVASRTYFWALSALLVVVGTGRLQEAPASVEEPTSPPPNRRRRRKRREQARPTASTEPSMWRSLWPYVCIGALILITLAYDYITNPTKEPRTWGVFWQALTTRYIAKTGQRVPGLGIIWLIGFTWLVGGLLLAGLLGRLLRWDWRSASRAFSVYTLGCWGAFLIFGLYQAHRLAWHPAPGEDVLFRVANNYTMYVVAMMVVMAALAAFIGWPRQRMTGPAFNSWLSPVIGVFTAGLLILIIRNVCINPIRADIIYKQGQGYDAERLWEQSIAIYRHALKLAPKEDYYYLFLGRAQLELARQTQDLNVRRQILQQAEETLIRARELNPLNTDHTANLARLYRNWGELTNDPAEREELWKRSAEYYEIATQLSPHAAHLYNEWGLIHYMLGNLYWRQGRQEEARAQFDLALEKYQRSLALDTKYEQTYLLLGDLYNTLGEWAKAVSAYEKAIALKPNRKQPWKVWSALSDLYARLGRLEDAITATQQVLLSRPNDASVHQALARLYEETGRLSEALNEARRARELAPEKDRAMLDQYIVRLESRLNEGGQ